MIYYFSHKRTFPRRTGADRRSEEIRLYEDYYSPIPERRISDRRECADRRIYNKGFPYRWRLISRLFD